MVRRNTAGLPEGTRVPEGERCCTLKVGPKGPAEGHTFGKATKQSLYLTYLGEAATPAAGGEERQGAGPRLEKVKKPAIAETRVPVPPLNYTWRTWLPQYVSDFLKVSKTVG